MVDVFNLFQKKRVSVINSSHAYLNCCDLTCGVIVRYDSGIQLDRECISYLKRIQS